MAKARSRDNLDDLQIDDCGRAAVKWMVALTSGSMTERQVRDFDRWRNASPGNAEAWNRMSGGLQPFDVLARSGLPHGTVSRMRGQPVRHDRRKLLAGLVGLAAAGSVGTASLQRFVPLEDMFNDHYTRTAEHDRFRLTDGSEVVLAPRSSINVALTATERGVELVRGRMMLDVANRDARPFVVDLGRFRLEASAGSFVVDRRHARLSITGLTGSGVIEGEGRRLAIRASERLSLDGAEFTQNRIDAGAEASWTTGIAVIDNEPIAAIVDQISPYYAGFIRLSPDVPNVHVTGVFNLFEPVAALEIMTRSVGLKTTHTAGLWIRIEPAA